MAKKLTLDINLLEGIEMLGIVTHLKDYRLAYYLNNAMKIQLKKYADFQFAGDEGQFSWYYFTEGGNNHNITLISNNHPEGKLVTNYKADYLLLIKNIFDEELVAEFITKLRKISDISLVFQMQLAKVKNIDFLLEAFEMHELKQVIRPDNTP